MMILFRTSGVLSMFGVPNLGKSGCGNQLQTPITAMISGNPEWIANSVLAAQNSIKGCSQSFKQTVKMMFNAFAEAVKAPKIWIRS